MIPHSRPSIGDEEAAAAARVVRGGHLAQGPEVAAFEAECAAFTGHAHAVAVSSGAAALHLALLACGVGPGARVAMPSYACDALPQAVAWCGASPALCDIRKDLLLDARAAEASDATAVIVPHLFGAQAELPACGALIEDIAQSIGGPGGRAGRVAVASFYATKLLTAGEGGMLLTDDAEIAASARAQRDYDNRDDWAVRFPYKMSDVHAAIGRVQLRRLPEFLAARRALAVRYDAALAGLPLRLPKASAGHVYFRYVVATPARDALMAFLAARGIEAKRPVHRPAHQALGGECPNAERAHREALSLPLYPAIGEAEQQRVIDCVRAYFAGAHQG